MIDSDTLKNLCETFKVAKGTCEAYERYYNNDILPHIQKNYLAHLVASLEEIINEKIKKGEITPAGEKPKFSIVLRAESPPPGKKSSVECQPYRALIKYTPSKDYKELRIFIAHELGHVVRNYKLILGNDQENHANLFAFFAINGKDKFYKNKVKDLLYSNEEEIIRSIEKVYPINDVRQES